MERTGRGPGEVMDDATWGLLARRLAGRRSAPTPTTSRRPSTSTAACRGGLHVLHDRSRRPRRGAGAVGAPRGHAARPRGAAREAARPRRPGAGAHGGRAAGRGGHLRRGGRPRRRPLRAPARPRAGRQLRARGLRRRDRHAAPRTPSTSTSPTRWRGWACAWVSLAPRFVGSFEKGIDYIGDVGALADDLAVHAAIARRLGPYKLSVHSGSDKFSAYPAIAEATGGVLHLKTAGTSYLEALRAVALPRRGADGAHLRVRARALRRGPRDLPPVRGRAAARRRPPDLEDPAVRQVLHVTFGSVLASELGRRAALSGCAATCASPTPRRSSTTSAATWSRSASPPGSDRVPFPESWPVRRRLKIPLASIPSSATPRWRGCARRHSTSSSSAAARRGRAARSTPPAAACRSRCWRRAISPPAPRAARASWSTAVCATSSRWSSASSTRRCASAACCST